MFAALLDRIVRPLSGHAAAVLVPYINGDHDAAVAALCRHPILSAICLRLGLFDAIR